MSKEQTEVPPQAGRHSEGAKTGSAKVQGDLWSERAADWAALQEGTAKPLFEHALTAIGVGPSSSVLDVGCGSGLALRLAADRGARVSGLDASAAFVALARTRVPDAELHAGEMETLPFEAERFDVVTGFNSFQYAASPPRALAEARRVARRGGAVVIATWGDAGACEATAYLRALGSLLPPPPPGAPGPFALSAPGRLEALATEAGLVPRGAHDVLCAFDYPDVDTALRALMSAGPAVRAIRTAGEDRVRAAVGDAIAPYRLSTGRVRLENVFRYLIART
jgi:SAM-dependent methyltransferase